MRRRCTSALFGGVGSREAAELWRTPRLQPSARALLLSCRAKSTSATEASDDPTASSAPRPRRAMLYVPGSAERMLKKSLESPADALCYDLEDSVAFDRKGEARSMVVNALNAAEPGRHERFVRINSLPTGLSQDDLEAVLSSDKLDGIVIPKVHSADDVRTVTGLIDQHARSPEQAKRLRIIASIESAQAILNLSEVCGQLLIARDPWHCHRIKSSRCAADFCADTGIVRTDSRIEMLHARSAIVLAAKAFKLQAIDMVCVKVKDLDVLQDECSEGQRLGFDGKQAIHPGQVEIIQKTFVPAEAEVARAVAVIEANTAAIKEGKGAFTFSDGLMIDAPMILQANAVLSRAKAAKMPISWTKESPAGY